MRRDHELTIARRAKKAGIGKAEYLTTRTDAMRRSAKSQGWTASELAMTLGDIVGVADNVYGKDKPLTPEDLDKALAVVSRPEFWCRAKLFRALEAARQKGVLAECLDEMEVPGSEVNRIIDHVEHHWKEKP